MIEILLKYIPEKSISSIQYLIEQNNFILKIVNQRQTKHGDFRGLPDGKFQITVNNNLNKHQFLLTLVHEIAHHVTHQKFGLVQPHGKEWKMVFQHLMLPFLEPEIYPKEILSPLANYLKNPKASTDSDVNLSLALKGNLAEQGKSFIFDIPNGSLFMFKNSIYKRGNKRRTRFECIDTSSKKVYLFNHNAEVKAIDTQENRTSLVKKHKTKEALYFIYEVAIGSLFKFNNDIYSLEKKRRTRYECLHIATKKTYLIHQNAEVTKYKATKNE